MMVKKTCRNRLTAFINTANKYNHASPDIVIALVRRSTDFAVTQVDNRFEDVAS
jgi:hypothetical protein